VSHWVYEGSVLASYFFPSASRPLKSCVFIPRSGDTFLKYIRTVNTAH